MQDSAAPRPLLGCLDLRLGRLGFGPGSEKPQVELVHRPLKGGRGGAEHQANK